MKELIFAADRLILRSRRAVVFSILSETCKKFWEALLASSVRAPGTILGRKKFSE